MWVGPPPHKYSKLNSYIFYIIYSIFYIIYNIFYIIYNIFSHISMQELMTCGWVRPLKYILNSTSFNGSKLARF